MTHLIDRLTNLIIRDDAVFFVGGWPLEQQVAAALAADIGYGQPDSSLTAVSRHYELRHSRTELIRSLKTSLATLERTPQPLLVPLVTALGVGLASSILSGAAVAAIRAARRTEGSWAIYGSFTLFGLGVAAPFALADFRWPNAVEWGLLILVGATSVAAQLLMTYAYRWVTNLTAGVFAQLTVVVATAIGVFLFGDPFGWRQGLGTLLALAGIVGVIWVQSTPRAVE